MNRGRLQLTGLEEPEELWERLKEATADAQAQAQTNKKLVARVQLLERKLSEAGSLTDDELVAELPKRMARALESAQAVANEIVGRARKQDSAIRQEATAAAAEIVRQAENRSANMLKNAATQATAHIVSAEEKAHEVIRAAQARRQQILAEIKTEAEALQQRIDGLQRIHSGLLHAYDVAETTLAEGRRALEAAVPAREKTLEARRPVARAPQARQPEAGRVVAPPLRRSRPNQGAPPLEVYDWSPAASSAG